MRTLALSVLIWIVWLPGLSHALGLGNITVKSALNQPLHAEIALSVERAEDLEDLSFKLAPEALFRRLGIERPHYLTELRFQPLARSDGQRVLQIQTPNPVREPFLNFLIEATWPGGRVVREYTVLLDPPKVFEPAPAASNLPVSVPSPSRPAPAATAPPAAPRPDTAAQTAQSYRVQAGDTLWQLGTRLRPDNDISVQQMMIALLRANPEAFIDNNINQVIRGRVLRIPSREEILALSQQEALQEVVRQNNLWRDYRTRLTQDPVSPPATTPVAQAVTPSAAPTPAPVERTPPSAQAAAPAEDRLEIRANDIPVEELEQLARAEQNLAVARETAEARRLEIEELRSRVHELEENLSRKDRLLTLTNEQMAELQQHMIELQSERTDSRVEETQQALSALTQEPPTGPDETTRTPEPPVSDTLAGLESLATPPEAAQTTLPLLEAFTEPPAHSILPDESLSPPVPEQDWAPTILDEPFADEPAAPLAVEPLPPATPVTPPPAAEPTPTPAPVPATPSLWEELLADPRLPLAGVGLAGILVLLLLWTVIRGVLRRKQEDSGDTLSDQMPTALTLNKPGGRTRDTAPEDLSSVSAATAPLAAAVPPKEQTVELPPEDMPSTPEQAQSPTDELQEATQAEKEIHTDDTIAEVDVYLAYGLFDQAEELLKNALNKHPERIDYHYKLVETYFATKNQDAFDAAAQNMHIALEGKPSALWKRVAEMAQELSPENPLFAAGGTTSGTGSSSVLAAGAAGAGLAGAAAAIGALDTKEFEFAPHELEETLSGVEFELDDEPTLGQDTIEQEIDLSATPTEAAEEIAPPTAQDFASELSDLTAAFDAVDVADPLTDDSFTIELDDVATDLDDSPREPASPSSETTPAVHDEHTRSPTAQEDDDLSIDLDDVGADLDDSPLEPASPSSETTPAVHDEHTRSLTAQEGDSLSIDLDDFGADLDDSQLEAAPPAQDAQTPRPTAQEDDALSIEQDDPFAATLDDRPEEEKSAPRDDARDTPAEEPDPFSTSSLDDFAFDAESPAADQPSSANRLATDTGDIMDFSADELESLELSDLEKELNQLDDAAPKGQDSTVELDADSEAFSIAFDRDTQSSDSADDFLSDLQLESTAHFERTDSQNDDLKADEFSDFADFTQTGEISTKIELARAYLEMGDPEGARATLEEVLAEGNDAQKDQASALLKQLPG
ncbi:FimV/HubP family polar landmark protein [Thiorhodospira sibirica]|uniref:FimV/HubP family polar landmark protein n=1 Tax=Thiorhodospira sibirica TaxID=154347 RepID=UPI00022C04E1|nr:FimV/HubP family polar landmark protein [Thiorhodospira sibirica]